MNEDNQLELRLDWAGEIPAAELPEIVLPSGDVTITQCAQRLFGLIAPSHAWFIRGGQVSVLRPKENGLLTLEIVRPEAARSMFEKFGR